MSVEWCLIMFKSEIMLLSVCVFMLIAHVTSAATLEEKSPCGKKNWQCNDGSCIRSILKCDGQSDCSDGSDESKETCSREECAVGMFQCDYGACIDSGGLCNGEADCEDGSDEDKNVCYRSEPTPTTPAVPHCELPQYIEHGNYSVIRVPKLLDSDIDFEMTVTMWCEPGYRLNGFPMVFCRKGVWEKTLPQCVRPCELVKNPNFKYYCPTIKDQYKECGDTILPGVTVYTVCENRKYFSPSNMKCSGGKWDRVPVCKPECGRVIRESTELTLVGDQALYSPAPWHATVYSKLTHTAVCGGSLISATVILSAAHCFWDSAVGLLPAPTYRVVVGTTHRQSTNDLDKYRQHRDVNDIAIPTLFDGMGDSLEYDIALVTVVTPFKISAFVNPVCLDFDPEFNERQLTENMYGKFASWDEASGILKTLELPNLNAVDCAKRYSSTSQLSITSDQICAEVNGTAQSRSTAGTGLAFANKHNGVERFYLRGVASKPSTNGKPLLLTQILKHKTFIGSIIGTA